MTVKKVSHETIRLNKKTIEKKVSSKNFLFGFSDKATVTKIPDSENRKLEGVAYAGGMIMNHGFWGNVVFDLKDLQFKPVIPVKYKHVDNIGKTLVSITDKITVDGTIIAGTPASQEVIALSDGDFPWEMSVYIQPDSIEQFSDGVKFNVNGNDFVGPASVFRNNRLREVSVLEFGADDTTSANIFSEENTMTVEITNNETLTEEQKAELAAKEKKEADEKAAKEIADKEASDKAAKEAVESEASKQFTEKIKTLEAQVKSLTEENKKFSEDKEKARTTSRMEHLNKFSELSDEQKKVLCALDDKAYDAMTSVMKSNKPVLKPYLFNEVLKAEDVEKYKFTSNDPKSITAAAEKLVKDRKEAGEELSFDNAVKILTTKKAV